MFVHTLRKVSIALIGIALFSPRMVAAQTRTFQACSQGALRNCAGIRLTSQLGVGPAGTNLFQIGIQNLGSQIAPALATSIYFATFLTGLNPAVTPVDAPPVSKSGGGAIVLDATPWSIFESGDAIFLSAPGNLGIGNCTFAGPVNGFGLMGQTCGAGQFIYFDFFTLRAINVNNVTLSDLELVAISGGNTSDSCNDDTPCSITSAVVTPEPTTLMLLVTGFAIVGVAGARRRTQRHLRNTFAKGA